MAWLPHVEKISKISLFVLAQLMNVIDGQTPGDGNSRAMHSIAQQKLLNLVHKNSETCKTNLFLIF